jgi:TatD DNase family protein
MLELVDIGANLAHRSFRGDLDAVLERAKQAGVRFVLVTGTSLEGSARSLEIAREHAEMLRSTAGIHPHDARRADAPMLEALEQLAREPDVVAVGECGLDYDRDFSPRDQQRSCFESQLELAAEIGKPVFLHERAAHADLVKILARHRSRLGRAVLHCFTGTEAELDAYLELGLDIGITGFIADERRGLHLRELVRKIPRDRLMIETDAPFLLPRTMQPPPSDRRNEPAFLPHVLDCVASALERHREDVARDTTATACAVFGLAP